MRKIKAPKDLSKLKETLLAKRNVVKSRVVVCGGTGCLAYGSKKVFELFKEEIDRHNLFAEVELKNSGCHGFCENGVVVLLFPQEICYLRVRVEDVAEIVSSTLIKKEIITRLLFQDLNSGERIAKEAEIPFYKHQSQLVFGSNRFIDPKEINDYIAIGGYEALAKVLEEMTPQEVIEEVKKANVRGRGGGGFPAGIKWETTRQAPGEIKYAVVNCDEGDPGAYMDRSIMEGNPHRVLEGLIINAYAIGASEGFIYIRQEYPLATENTLHAISQAQEYGLLGKNILGSSFHFSVTVHRGAGAFVSGESSALMAAIEGRVGQPRPKYTRTAVSGIWGRPSNLNNVETLANIPLVINRGADWYSSIGTENSKGTKIFSLVGNVNNTGLVEVPMGTTIREIVYDIGGGIPGGKEFKAVQIGGPSGGCIPQQFLDMPIDFDEFSKVGAMMGSGGMIVMDEETCMVDVARYFLDFLAEESCGKCVPCREGIKQLLAILQRISRGEGNEGDLSVLEELADVISDASLCALGQTAANPVLTAIKYFREEYLAHILEKRCPTKVCQGLITYFIDPEKCRGCGACLKNCPSEAIDGDRRQIHVILQDKCIKCGICADVCPEKFHAVRKLSGEPVPAVPLNREICRGEN
ncbi:MAG: NADH-ubiquinone oxidoreductase-F iron-sulfur binding region domain-containing protein [Bacillota bacterium]|nr:NADH-ubiquinone oxidoreductase-F iron-sulfur binding region domain-containing protein [Bacillota bacterium]